MGSGLSLGEKCSIPYKRKSSKKIIMSNALAGWIYPLEQLKGRSVQILFRRYLIHLVILKVTQMSAPKSIQSSFFVCDKNFQNCFLQVSFLGVSLALLNSGSEVQLSALLTSPPENTGPSSLKTPWTVHRNQESSCLFLPPCYRSKECTINSYHASFNVVFIGTQWIPPSSLLPAEEGCTLLSNNSREISG